MAPNLNNAGSEYLNISYTLDNPEWWIQEHARQIARLEPAKRDAAVAFLRTWFDGHPELRDQVKAAATKEVMWFTGYHVGWGMSMRNLLREQGHGEKELGIDNMDDVYVPLIETALGLQR